MTQEDTFLEKDFQSLNSALSNMIEMTDLPDM